MTWEREVAIAGFEGEFSRVALRMLMLILFRQNVLDYFMETKGTAGYQRAYYERNRDKLLKNRERNIRKKYGMSIKEFNKKYYRENKDLMRERKREWSRKDKERKKLERMWG